MICPADDCDSHRHRVVRTVRGVREDTRLCVCIDCGETFRADLTEDLKEELRAQAAREYEWIGSRTLARSERQLTMRVLRGAGEGFARMEGSINKRLRRVVLRAISENAPFSEIENRVASALSTGRRHAFTVANTARTGFSRANFFRSAREVQEGEAEELHYKYVGPPPERPFCQKHLGEVYSKPEINALDNGQGLPVDLYGGGYNCRHRWVLASDEEAKAARRRKREAAANAGGAGSGGASGGGGGKANEEDRMLYRNEKTGGTLHVAGDRSPSDSERYAGRVLADEGRTVRLLRRSEAQGVKSYDADVDSRRAVQY